LRSNASISAKVAIDVNPPGAAQRAMLFCGAY